MVPEDLRQITAVVAAAEQRMADRLDRAVEALTTNLSEVRQELSVRMDTLDHRMDTLDRRFEAQASVILTMDQRVSQLVRQSDRVERDNGAMIANNAAQQRAIDALAARVTRIERKIEIQPDQQ